LLSVRNPEDAGLRRKDVERRVDVGIVELQLHGWIGPKNHDQKQQSNPAVLAIASNASFVFRLISKRQRPGNIS